MPYLWAFAAWRKSGPEKLRKSTCMYCNEFSQAEVHKMNHCCPDVAWPVTPVFGRKWKVSIVTGSMVLVQSQKSRKINRDSICGQQNRHPCTDLQPLSHSQWAQRELKGKTGKGKLARNSPFFSRDLEKKIHFWNSKQSKKNLTTTEDPSTAQDLFWFLCCMVTSRPVAHVPRKNVAQSAIELCTGFHFFSCERVGLHKKCGSISPRNPANNLGWGQVPRPAFEAVATERTHTTPESSCSTFPLFFCFCFFFCTSILDPPQPFVCVNRAKAVQNMRKTRENRMADHRGSSHWRIPAAFQIFFSARECHFTYIKRAFAHVSVATVPEFFIRCKNTTDGGKKGSWEVKFCTARYLFVLLVLRYRVAWDAPSHDTPCLIFFNDTPVHACRPWQLVHEMASRIGWPQRLMQSATELLGARGSMDEMTPIMLNVYRQICLHRSMTPRCLSAWDTPGQCLRGKLHTGTMFSTSSLFAYEHITMVSHLFGLEQFLSKQKVQKVALMHRSAHKFWAVLCTCTYLLPNNSGWWKCW